MSLLTTAESYPSFFGAPDNIPVAGWASYIYNSGNQPNDNTLYDSIVLPVFVNQGRWMASCPFGCGEAQVTSETDHRWYCTTCSNFGGGGKWVPTIWPDNQADIETALVVRPPVFQNWVPGETVEQLLAENLANAGVS
jgi:hypothetical protein